MSQPSTNSGSNFDSHIFQLIAEQCDFTTQCHLECAARTSMPSSSAVPPTGAGHEPSLLRSLLMQCGQISVMTIRSVGSGYVASISKSNLHVRQDMSSLLGQEALHMQIARDPRGGAVKSSLSTAWRVDSQRSTGIQSRLPEPPERHLNHVGLVR